MTEARRGAWFWLFCFQFFIAEQIARFSVRGPYSMSFNAISNLGAVHCFGLGPQEPTSCSPLHALMNASFLLQGLLIFTGAVLVRRGFPSRGIWRAAFLSFELSAVGLFIVGLAPEDIAGHLHVLAATVHFVCGALGMLLLGLALLRGKGAQAISGTLTVGAGMIALAATVLLGFSGKLAAANPGWPTGAVERVAAYPLPLWLSITGLVLLCRTRTTYARARTKQT